MRRTRSLKISAPPPGIESMPASRSRSQRLREWRFSCAAPGRPISTMVNAFRCTSRKALLQAAQHLAVPIQRQLRMQPAHDVKFGDGFAPAFARALPHLVERHGVSLGIAHALAEGAQPATGHAHVGGVDVAVDVEISDVAVQPLAHQVGQVAQAPECRGCGRARRRRRGKAARRPPPFREWEPDGDRRCRLACVRRPVCEERYQRPRIERIARSRSRSW